MISPLWGAALAAVRSASLEAQAAGELPFFLGELERVRVEILLSAAGTAPESPLSSPKKDCLLSVKETAERIGRSKWWVYQNKAALPIVRLPTGRYGFSERGLETWIRRRSS